MKRARWNGDLVDLLRWKTLGTEGMERATVMSLFARAHGLTYAAVQTKESNLRSPNDPAEKPAAVSAPRKPAPSHARNPICYVCKQNRTEHKQHRMCRSCRDFYTSAA